jgi:hypothetical protein
MQTRLPSMRAWTPRLVWLLLALVLQLASVGCATVHPKITYQGFGEADPEGDHRVMENYRKSRETKVSKQEVRVLVDTLPEGLVLEGKTLKTQDGYQHNVLGKFAVSPKGPVGPWGLLVFPDYRQSWRKGYCYWQAPLGWLTIGIWPFFVPLAYPCWPTPVTGARRVLSAVRNLVKSAGGDMAVIGYIRHDGRIFGATGFAIRIDPRMRGKKLKTRPTKLRKLQQKSL